MIKDAGRLLYCDGLASSRLVGVEGGGGERKLLNHTDFVHLKHHRIQRPSSCERTCSLSVSASISRTPLSNELTEPLLWGVAYCMTPSLYMYIQPGMLGPVEFCSMTEHLKTPINSMYSSSSPPPLLLFLALLFTHTHICMSSNTYAVMNTA